MSRLRAVLRHRRVAAGIAGVVAGLLVAGVLPELLVPTGLRLGVAALLGLGAWSIVRRIGHVDLATGAAAGVGGYVGGAGVALVGAPAALALVAGPLGGAVTSALVGAVGARVGRVLGALTSLAIGAAVVGLLRTGELLGGPAGFHAVPYLSPSGRIELAVALAAAVTGIAATPTARLLLARGAVAAGAAPAAAGLGRRPSVDAALASAPGGAMLGLAGALGALGSGSLVPDAYGLALSAALALSALLAGASPLAGAVAAVAVLGPGALAPGVAVVATAPLLVTGVLGLALLVVLPDGLVRSARPRVAGLVRPHGGDRAPPVPRRTSSLAVREARLPGGSTVSFDVAPGEITALAGPNGAGKSTLLARIGGQIPDDGVVAIGLEDEEASTPPGGSAARARLGIARSWQHPPNVDVADLLAVALDGGDVRAARWTAEVLGEAVDSPAGAMVVAAVARRPGLLLLDEPAAQLPSTRVTALLEGLAAAGVAVLVAEHRAEVIAAADRVVRLVDGAGGTDG